MQSVDYLTRRPHLRRFSASVLNRRHTPALNRRAYDRSPTLRFSPTFCRGCYFFVAHPSPSLRVLGPAFRRRVPMNICVGLLLAGICCASNNACLAQQGSAGPDGLYLPPPETSLAKQQIRKRSIAKEQKPSSESKATNWQEEEAQQHADDDRLKRKMNICQRC
jgi:hypothetical protein